MSHQLSLPNQLDESSELCMRKVETVKRMVARPPELVSERPKLVLLASTQSEVGSAFHFAKTSWSVGRHKQTLTQTWTKLEFEGWGRNYWGGERGGC